MAGVFCSSSGPEAGYLHFPRCLLNCPKESQSCFLSSKTFSFFFLEILPSPLHAPGVSSVCFLICFSDHLGRKHLHTSRNFMSFANNTTVSVGYMKNNFVVFKTIQMHPVFILYILSPHQPGHKYSFPTAPENPLQFRVQYISNLIYIHIIPIQFTIESVWVRILYSISIWVICELLRVDFGSLAVCVLCVRKCLFLCLYAYVDT